MKPWIGAILWVCCASWPSLAASKIELDEATRMLSSEDAKLNHDASTIPPCVLQGLRHWTQTRFVIVNWKQPFPPVKNIAHTGDAQYRLLFSSKLSSDMTLLCFQNNTGIGAAYHALFFLERNHACDVKYQFAFAGPVWSMKELRSAIIENAKYESERNKQR